MKKEIVEDKNYNIDSENNTIQKTTFQKGETHTFTTEKDTITFITEGALSISIGRKTNPQIVSPCMLLIPLGVTYDIAALSDTEMTRLTITIQEDLYRCLSEKEEISEEIVTQRQNYIYTLPLSSLVTDFLRVMNKSIARGLNNPDYLELKAKELLYIMQTDYSTKECSMFFESLQGNDRRFIEFIYKNYQSTPSIRDLAKQSFYSLSGFEKKFRRVFGKSASQWAKEMKASDVYREIVKGEKTFKQISFEYGFCSPAHFNDFCKNQLGHTPGEIRRRVISENKPK